ncbi:diguanylate cyclase (GGDEF)-like protein [Rhodoferax ferrireducens]|uniref:diguanylate cyclase n=1 Tax=Rhodoferax ferrireducens TaxID=192843 RepID=A0ABU2CAX0_9BURK|nr:GGDEF domain-containing protein [Rhodoferax ferrireducens]MDR7378377.1 diguanylate cyclase (GGDEF)-like protein [Rhodoferax ferrireducens]
MPNLPFRSLAGHLIRRTLGLALCCMVAVFVVQVGIMLQHQRKEFERLADEIAKTSVPLLSVSLWDIELRAVQQQVAMMAERPEVGYVMLTVGTGQQFQAGNAALQPESSSLRIAIPAPQGKSVIAELRLWPNPQFAIDEMVHTAWTVLAGYGVFTVLICSLIAYLLRRELQIPLQRLAQFASELTPQTLVQPLALDRPRRIHTDEIDLVAHGFSKLQNGLRTHIANLDKMVAERTQQLEALAEANHVLSITDPLTGCFNRRTLEPRLLEEIERAHRYQRPFSVICLDLDHFKQINDSYGHAAGDAVLCATADHLRNATRFRLDWTVRLGGEEFLIVLPETVLATALQNAERLRQLLQAEPVWFEGQRIDLTASFGVAQWQYDQASAELVQLADSLLYQAKAAGRNCIFPQLPAIE